MIGLIRIVLIDDHQTFLDLLKFGIDREDDLMVVGTARTAAEGRTLVARTCPDVVLLESALPDGDGLAILAALVVQHPRASVVMLTAAEDTDLPARVAAAGAAGFLAKSGALARVIDTIRSARPGSMIIDPLFLATLPAESGSARRIVPLPVLTNRESAVLGLLDQGKDPRTIARELSISLHTARGYVKSLLVKLDCHSQLEAVVTGRRLGLLADPVQWSAAG